MPNQNQPMPMKRKMKDSHKHRIVELYAEFRTPAETVDVLASEFPEFQAAERGTDDWNWLHGRVRYYRNHPDAARWQALAESHRKLWLANLSDLKFAHKRSRVEELSHEYEKIPDDYKWKEFKDGSITNRMNTEAKVKVLEQIRKEVEGERVEVVVKKERPNPEDLTDEQLDRLLAGEDEDSVLGVSAEAGEGTP